MIQSIPFFTKTWTTAHVEKINDSVDNIRHIWLRPQKAFKYKPGQNITLQIPNATNEVEQQRTYSIANAPQKNGLIELCISYVEGGKASEFIFNDINVGSILKIRSASGKFTLPKKIKTDLVFICMGSALAPARSMIQHIFQQELAHQKVHLIYGSKSAEGLLCSREFSGLAIQYQEFKYSFAYSREQNASNATKRKYVHEIYQEEYANPRKDVTFYVSGSISMIEETIANLTRLGYKKSQIVYDMNG